MNSCILPLYNYSEDNLDFLNDIIEKSTINDVASKTSQALKEKASFATSSQGITDNESYEDNVRRSLIPALIKHIEKVWRVNLTSKSKSSIVKELSKAFIKEEKNDKKQEVPSTETPEEKNDKKKEYSLRKIRNLLFKTDFLREYQKKQFQQEIRNRIIFDSSSGQRRIVYDQETLNKNLKQYKQELYETIYDYCREHNIQVKQKRQYVDSENNIQVEENLDAFFKYLSGMNPEERQSLLEADWESTILNNKKAITLLDAVNAYINLTKFDEVIEENVGKYIQIDKKLDEPINNIEENNRIITKYKYNFGRKKTNMQKDFREVMQNALDTMGNFSKFLIEGIPRIDSFSNINQIQFINSLLHLKAAIYRLPSEYEILKSTVLKVHNSPGEYWKVILDDFANRSGYSDFRIAGLTDEDIVVINSIHRYIYGKTSNEKENSLYRLEQDIHNEIGYKEIYPLVDTLLGTIDSISDLSYLEVVWNYEKGMPEVTEKKKYFIDKEKLDIIDGISREATKTLSESTKSRYDISYLSGEFQFKIGNLTFLVYPTDKKSELGIFSENISVYIIDENGKQYTPNQYFDEVPLNGIQNRRLVRNNPTGINKDFMDLLTFIDDALQTGFHSTDEGLQKYFIYRTNYSRGLNDLIIASAKTYLVKDIQTQFINAVKNREINIKTGEVYHESDLQDWLQANPSKVPSVQLSNPENKVNKKYFKHELGRTFIRPVQQSDTWINELSNAKAIMRGENLRATTKDFNRNNIPNYSPAFLGAEIKQELALQNESTTTGNLLFVKEQSAVESVLIDTDVKTVDGKHKAVSDMTETELQYHAFVNKFIIPSMNNRFIAQPTVYSDKKKFVNYVINLININDINTDEKIIQRIKETLGQYYDSIYNNVLNDYSKIFGTTDVQSIQATLKTLDLPALLRLVDNYNKENPGAKLELIQDVHYRNIGGQLTLNENLFYYSQYLYKDNNLETRLEQEKLNYINSLLRTGTIFDTSVGTREAFNNIADKLNITLSNWLEGDNLILAKITDSEGNIKNIVSGEKIQSLEGVEINPIISRYVLLHNLINNNLKESLTGSDIVHKIKLKRPQIILSKEERDILKLPEKANYVDLQLAAYSSGDQNIINKVNRQILSSQSKAQNAQLKRTVPIPGTMRYYLQGTLTGILPTLKCAVMEDILAPVFNLDGQVKNDLEAHDGGAYLNPITSIFQNNSLQDSEVGTIIKPLWDVSVNDFGVKRLVKYAAHTITNETMIDSEESQISFRKMFKEMTNIRWGNAYNSQDKNILNQYLHREDDNNVKYSDIFQSGNVYFTIGNNTYQITKFGWDENGYYTEETEVGVNLSDKSVYQVPDSTVRYYHYFDETSDTHYKFKEGESIPEGLHTIDSIYELHTALGGIYSQSFQNGVFVNSESSTRAVANILNMVSEYTEEYERALEENRSIEHSQKFYRQPLKGMMVDYLINQSALKNGTGNLNFREKYFNIDNELNQNLSEESNQKNKDPLRYIELPTLRYGIQQDSDHEADEAELTEMSQVISSIDAGGYYHEQVKELYRAIGDLALKASSIELSKLKIFKEDNDYNVLYDILGRTLIEHIGYNRGQSGLAEALVSRLKKTFSVNSDHKLDDIKIPFSDQAIYSQIISTLSSILNKKSVKRKFPGTGQVMVPGYNIVQVWDLGETQAKYGDLIKEASNALEAKLIEAPISTNPEEYNKQLVKNYLNYIQQKYAEKFTKEIPIAKNKKNYTTEFWEDQFQNINPISVVQIVVNKTQKLTPFKLDKIEDYYLFKSNPLKFIKDKFNYEGEIDNLSVVKRIDIPRDLAPLRLSFTYEDSLGVQHTKNIYDHWAVKQMYFGLEQYKQNLKKESIDDNTLEKELEKERIRLRSIEQKHLNLIDSGIYEDSEGNQFKIVSQTSLAAETIMSNIYKSKFGLNDNESLYDILKQGKSRFKINPTKFLPKESLFDLAFLKANGEGLFISFDNNELSTLPGYYRVKSSEFKNINKHKVVESEKGWIDEITGKVINRNLSDGRIIENVVYLLDENNSEVTQTGVEVNVTDNVEYDAKSNTYFDKNTKEKIKNREFTRQGDQILEYIEFVQKKVVNPRYSDNYVVYNIKKGLVSEILGKDYINEILQNLYKTDNYAYITPPKDLNPNSIDTIVDALKYFMKSDYDNETKEYLNKLLGGINYAQKSTREGSLIRINGFNKYFSEYNNVISERMFSSFQRSLDFISSRIPAQSLQSFMKMKTIGYCGVDTNQAYVSHWQAWLQGSDY